MTVNTLSPAVRSPRNHADLLRYAEEQRFVARGGVVRVLSPEPNPPQPVLFPHLGVYEPISYGAMIHAAEPVMMDMDRAERGGQPYRIPPALRESMEASGTEFGAAVALLCADLQALKPATWPPVQDDAYFAAMAHLGA